MRFFWLASFGLLGVFSRYGIDAFFSRFEQPVPIGTLTINLLGSFLAGVIYVLGVERNGIPADLRTGILVGFLGGFTTFSAYALQTSRLFEEGETLRAALYLSLSPVLGLAACLGGLQLARTLLTSR